MDNSGYLNLQSRGMPVSGPEVDNLAKVCSENGVDFRTTLYRMDSVQASVLQPWLTLIFSPEVIVRLEKQSFGWFELYQQICRLKEDVPL